jgi:hypothetical protein
MNGTPFANLDTLAAHLRNELGNKKYILLYAYNGTGKTRLSMVFKNIGRQGDERDTLYFNAFTEDLFTWDNDLAGDSERVLKINSTSRFFAGLAEMEMDNRIRPFLHRYADFDFRIDTDAWVVRFSRTIGTETLDNIKVSRGEENIFIWCFFLAIVQLALDETEAYRWVKYIYIDDPISSLDEHNAVMAGNHLGQMLKGYNGQLKSVISSHHTLFFNVLCNELGRAKKYFLSGNRKTGDYVLRDTGDTPFFHHLAQLQEIYKVRQSGQMYTHHFNALRNLLEKAAMFHGYTSFSVCIKQEENDPDETFFGRLLNIISHGNYSFYEPREMLTENKEHFGKVLDDFLDYYSFNPELFSEVTEEIETT